ncbi:hypothetical protein [Demequina sp. NBRC 110054]|uniref:hypothetical protein n=1 Tax=Demequina sp. NBRC 110054 TaxID=1570343 RepID=UPI0009FF46F1|nr:hypothetical protein [Demequina sp. NBRC 110054]
MDIGGEVTQLRRIVGVGEAVYVAAGARAEVVRALAVPELRAPDKVLMQGEAVVALMPLTDGQTLADVMRATGPLSAGGCVWVGTRVARALARLHRAGMAHGAVEADNIVIESGHAVLLDAGSGVASATQSDDVAALGRLLRGAVRDGDADVMAAWTNPMSAADPAARPTAAMVARALPGAAQERPIALPGPSVASRMRDSVEAGAPEPTRKRDDAAARRVSSDAGGPWSRWASSLETTPRRLAGLVGLAGSAVVACGAAIWLLMGAGASTAESGAAGADEATSVVEEGGTVASASDGAGSATGEPSESADAESAGAMRAFADGTGAAVIEDPAEAAAWLTERRFEALAGADPSALVATTVPGSAARERAQSQAADVEAGVLTYEDLEVRVETVEVEEEGEESATVTLTYVASAHVVVVQGERSEVDAQRDTVELRMEKVKGSWRVADVGSVVEG